MTTRGVNNNLINSRNNGSITVSQATIRSRLFLQENYGGGIGTTFEPIRSSNNGSITPGHSATLFRQRPIPDISATLNPKRVSVATSTFWEGHPDMAHLVQNVGIEKLGKDGHCGGERRPKSSLWGTGQAMESWGWGDPPALKKGILLQQKEKHFLARWKERYCILTRDYLHCFRRTTSIHRSGVRLSEMGNFIFKLRLADMDDIQLEKRRIGTVISIILPNEPKILLKVIGEDDDCTRQWFTLLQECLYTSKERRQALRTLHSSGTEAFRTRNSLSDEGSPSTHSSNSNSDTEKSPRDEPSPPSNTEEIVLRNPGKKTSLKDFIKQENGNNRHSISIAEDFEDGTTVGRRQRRPDSWTPHPRYNSSSLLPSSAPWLSQRRSIALGPTPQHLPIPTFSKASNSHLYSTSRHTSEITFRKMT